MQRKPDPALERQRREMERQEKADLKERIITLTNRIPDKLRNGGSIQMARDFKSAAVKARALAESPSPTVDKLRAAFNSIESYYRG